jgi:ADP-ribose pyrophosphatase YjhB (NUDIX family)
VIAYENPRVIVSTIVAQQDAVLLCHRADPPAAGRWALPGGFLECGESLQEAAARETFEETGIRLSPQGLSLHVLSALPELAEVYVGFRIELSEPAALVCGSECMAVRFFEESAVPWSELSYPDVAEYLRVYFRERRESAHAVHLTRLDATGVEGSAYRIASVESTLRLRR